MISIVPGNRQGAPVSLTESPRDIVVIGASRGGVEALSLTESQNSTLCIYVVGDRKMWYLGRSFSGSGDRNGRRIE
jgi:hypothetical protein